MIVVDILQRVLPLLRNGRSGSVTGTSTATTIVDTRLIGDVDDYFNGGFVVFLTGTHAGKTRTVTDFVQSTGTLTLESSLGSAPVVGDQYLVSDPRFPRHLVIQALNEALNELGPYDKLDETLVTTADTESYTLPTGVSQVKQVILSDSADTPYSWNAEPDHYWFEVAGKIYFMIGHWPAADLGIRLIYDGYHGWVSVDTDAITAPVDQERLVWETVLCAARMRLGESENLEPWTKELMAEALQKVRQMRRIPIPRRPSTVRYSGW